MRQLLPFVLLAGVTVGQAAPPPSLVGPRLPTGYVVNEIYTPKESSVYLDGERQVIAASNPQKYSFLVMARDARTGRTLWKIQGRGVAFLDARLAGQGAVMVTVITSGAITRSRSLLLDARNGQARRESLFTLDAVRDGRALLMEFGDVPIGAPFLADPNLLRGEVVQLQGTRTLTRNIPIHTRAGCGPLKTLQVNSNRQAYRLNDARQLVVRRQDKCGTFEAVYDWWKVPLPRPSVQVTRWQW